MEHPSKFLMKFTMNLKIVTVYVITHYMNVNNNRLYNFLKIPKKNYYSY